MIFNLFGKEIHIKKVFIVIAVVILASILGIVGFIISQKHKDENQVVFEKNNEENALSQVNMTASTTQAVDFKQTSVKENKPLEEIKVYVTGCVKKPGIVTIKKNLLINDAIEQAGGAKPEADLNNINLVYPLKENVMIYIKSKEEAKVSIKKGEAGSGIAIVSDSGGAVVNSPTKVETAKGIVNLNSASIDELDTLPGVGKETAKDIISYREKKQFKTTKDVMQVPGIKESKFNKIKDFITVE